MYLCLWKSKAFFFKLSSKKPHACHLHSPPCLTAQFQWNLLNKWNNKEAAKIILTSFSFFSISACSFSQAATRTSLYSSHTTYPSVLGRRTQSSVSYEKEKEREQMPADPAQQLQNTDRTVCLKGSKCVTAHMLPSTQHMQPLQDINIWQVQQSSFYIHWVWVATMKIKSSDGLNTVNVQLPCHSVQVWKLQLHTANR